MLGKAHDDFDRELPDRPLGPALAVLGQALDELAAAPSVSPELRRALPSMV
jgi:hypothetical protein